MADDAEVEEEPAARRRSLAQFLNQLEQKRSGRTKLASGDQDVALRDEEAAARKRRRVPEPGEDDGMGDFFGQGGGLEGGDSDGAEDDMYEAAREAKRARKAERSAKFAPKPVLPPKPEVVTGPRKASSQILQNRGLVPSRNKLSRCVRMRRRCWGLLPLTRACAWQQPAQEEARAAREDGEPAQGAGARGAGGRRRQVLGRADGHQGQRHAQHAIQVRRGCTLRMWKAGEIVHHAMPTCERVTMRARNHAIVQTLERWEWPGHHTYSHIHTCTACVHAVIQCRL